MNIITRALDRLRPIHYELPNGIFGNGTGGQPPTSPSEDEQLDDFFHRIDNHPPRDDEVIARLETVAGLAKMFGSAIILDCPAGREQALALTHLEQATMWARAAIARNQDAIPAYVPEHAEDDLALCDDCPGGPMSDQPETCCLDTFQDDFPGIFTGPSQK